MNSMLCLQGNWPLQILQGTAILIYGVKHESKG